MLFIMHNEVNAALERKHLTFLTYSGEEVVVIVKVPK